MNHEPLDIRSAAFRDAILTAVTNRSPNIIQLHLPREKVITIIRALHAATHDPDPEHAHAAASFLGALGDMFGLDVTGFEPTMIGLRGRGKLLPFETIPDDEPSTGGDHG